ncbi:linear amide C-N hydrolase [Enterococcus sp. LJL98]
MEAGITYSNKYAFIGAGRQLEEYLFADVFNEKGLAICSIYFNDYASYAPAIEEGKINLAPMTLFLEFWEILHRLMN